MYSIADFLLEQLSLTPFNERNRSEKRKHCALAVVRRSQNFFALPQTPFPGARDGQNLISWRWSLYLYLQTQFGEDR